MHAALPIFGYTGQSVTYIRCKQSDIWVDNISKQNIDDQFIQRWTSDIIILLNVLIINNII